MGYMIFLRDVSMELNGFRHVAQLYWTMVSRRYIICIIHVTYCVL